MKQIVTDLKFALVIAVLLGTCALFFARYYEAHRPITVEYIEANMKRGMSFEEACKVLHRDLNLNDLEIRSDLHGRRYYDFTTVPSEGYPQGGRFGFIFELDGTYCGADFDNLDTVN